MTEGCPAQKTKIVGYKIVSDNGLDNVLENGIIPINLFILEA